MEAIRVFICLSGWILMMLLCFEFHSEKERALEKLREKEEAYESLVRAIREYLKGEDDNGHQ